ncbi:MAG: hypothetical protein IJ523_01915 [Succinivibrionaceae bacterium]|nr:hypothetical protein [Succinivibrionaceae bacterium]
MKFSLILCIVAIAFTSGCTTQFRTGDFTILSTKNINLDNGQLVHRERVVNEEQSLNNDPLYIKDAIDHAIDQDRCAVALSDVAIYVIRGFGSYSIKVEGNKVIDLNRKGCENK